MSSLRTVGQLKDSVSGILQSTNIDNVTNLYGAIERSARILAQEADVPDSFGNQNYMLFDGVYDYLAPDTLFGGAFADLRPQGVSRTLWESVNKQPIELFDRTKAWVRSLQTEVTFEWNQGTPIMRVAGERANQKLLIDPLSDATQWSPTTITSLVTDTATYYQQPASIRFTLPTTGSMTRTLTTPLDMSSYVGVGSVFLAIRIESTDLTSVELRLGSDASNYYTITATTGFLGALKANNFYLMQFNLSTATTVGSPVSTAIDYVQMNFIATGTMPNVRVGYLFASLPSAYEMIFYSAAVFLSNGVTSNTISDDNDEIILGDAAYTIMEYITAETVSSQMGGKVSQIVLDRIGKRLRDPVSGLLPGYRADNPSEELRQVGSYYEY